MHIDYPIDIDRVLGVGRAANPPAAACARTGRGPDGEPRWRVLDGVLVWTHWTWFMVPHASLDIHPRASPRTVSAGRRDDLRGVRSRRERVLAGADRAAVVRRTEGRPSDSAAASSRRSASSRCGE